MLTRAVAKLDAVKLVFVGNADERFADEAMAEALMLGAPVLFLGAVPEVDLPSLYSLATVVACPSMKEGFGLPLLEAMSCGTPVVCSDIPVFREVAGDAALYADPRDEAAWTRLLGDVLASPALESNLRNAGLARAAAFTWHRTAHSLLPLYRKLFS
jgi:glycosyltransferase involved in cell wall biosynthesis